MPTTPPITIFQSASSTPTPPLRTAALPRRATPPPMPIQIIRSVRRPSRWSSGEASRPRPVSSGVAFLVEEV